MTVHAVRRATRFTLLLVLLLLVAGSAAARPRVGFVETRDPYTRLTGLGELLQEVGSPGRDLTPALRRGRLRPKGLTLLLIGSYVTADPELRTRLAAAARALERFVDGGGVLVVGTQADTDEPRPAWLPAPLEAVRGDRDAWAPLVRDPEHPLWRTPERVAAESLVGLRVEKPVSEPAVGDGGCVDTFRRLAGFRVLAAGQADGSDPCVALARRGRGLVLLVQLPFDKVALAPPSPTLRTTALALLNNIVQLAAKRRALSARDTAPDPAYARPARELYRAQVFEDGDADGVPDPDEPPLAGVELVLWPGPLAERTDAQGECAFEVPGGTNGRIAVSVPNGYWPSTPFWQPLPAVGSGPLVFGLRPAAPRSRDEPFCIAQLTDLHLGFRPPEQDVRRLRGAAAVVNAHQPPIQLVFVTGDIAAAAGVGAFEALAAAQSAYRAPLLALPGNHDIGRGPDPGRPYDERLGPRHYVWEAGGFRFVVWAEANARSEALDFTRERLLASTLPVALITHAPPRQTLIERLMAPAEPGAPAVDLRLVMVGDWHDASLRRAGTLTTVWSAPTLMGGWDHSPPAVRTVCLPPSGAPTTDLRLLGLYEWLTVAAPRGSDVAPTGPIVVHAYHTPAPVGEVTATLRAALGGRALARPRVTPLEAVGPFTWRGELPGLVAGEWVLDVTARAADRSLWTASQTFRVVADAPDKPPMNAADAWPTLRGNPARSGTRREPLPPPLRLDWVGHLGGEVYQAGPVAAQGLVLGATLDRTHAGAPAAAVTALDLETGKRRWRVQAQSSVRGSPVIAGDLAVWQEEQGLMRAVELLTGTERWRYDLAAVEPAPHSHYLFLGSPLATDSLLFPAWPCRARAIDLQTGALAFDLGTLDATSAVTHAAPLLAGDLVVVPTRHAGLFAYRPERDGRWKRAWRARSLTLSATPVYADGKLYVAHHQGLAVIDPKRGRRLRNYAARLNGAPAAPLVAAGLIVIAGADGELVALEEASGRERWRLSSGPGLLPYLPYRADGRAFAAAPVLADDTLYVAGLDGKLWAVSLDSGKILWRSAVGLPLAASPALVGQRLLAVDVGGNVYAFRP